MEGGIYVQEVFIQRKIIIERGSNDICGEIFGSKKYTLDHTAFYCMEKMTYFYKVDAMPTQHMVFGKQSMIQGFKKLKLT